MCFEYGPWRGIGGDDSDALKRRTAGDAVAWGCGTGGIDE